MKKQSDQGDNYAEIHVTWQFFEVSGPRVTFSKQKYFGYVLGKHESKFKFSVVFRSVRGETNTQGSRGDTRKFITWQFSRLAAFRVIFSK